MQRSGSVLDKSRALLGGVSVDLRLHFSEICGGGIEFGGSVPPARPTTNAARSGPHLVDPEDEISRRTVAAARRRQYRRNGWYP